jgi:hypothetical protein
MRNPLLVPVLLCLAAPSLRADEPLEEYQALAKVIKAFLGLVTWPGGTDRPLHLVVIGGNGFGTDLDTLLARGTVGGRRVEVHYVSATTFLTAPLEADALFVDRGQESVLPSILSKVKGRPVLTMGFAPALASRGAMVNFVVEGPRMTFEVNPNRAKEVGIVISSRLLGLARIVEG